MNSTMKIGQSEFEILGECSDSDLAWEWHEARLLRDGEGNLFYISGAGCSCSYLGDYETEGDLVPVKSAAEAVELAKLESFTPADIFDFASQVVR